VSIRPTRELYIPSLDGIRAISWSVVFLSHALPQLGSHVLSGIARTLGQFGVTVFFFLSGYLITSLLRIEIEDTGRVDFQAFYIRRALRILPPCYIGIVVAVVLAKVVPGATVVPGAVASLACHFTNYYVILHDTWDTLPPGTGVYWSLSVEEHFYLVFPVLFVLSQRLREARSRAILFWVICAVVLGWRCWLSLVVGEHGNRTFAGTDTRFDSLLFGCALAVWRNPMLDPERSWPDRVWKGVFFPVALVALAASLVGGDWVAFRETFRYTLQGIALIPVFVCAVRFPKWGPFVLLNHPLARTIGGLSYSLYLIHNVLLATLERMGVSTLPRFVLALALSFGAAWLIQRYVERPAARLRKRIMARRALPPRKMSEPLMAPADAAPDR
jgi:peptidoglycan/LPS O-acetylase OafA/YrhL